MNIKKHIPNAITCLNLLSGSLAIVYALHEGELEIAALLIALAAVFDFFDGLVARLLGVTSPIGKDLDSLADVVSFGVAPSVLVLHSLLMQGYSLWSAAPVLLIGAFAGLRLAKFNNDARQSTSFIGLPVPANAIFWLGLYRIIDDLHLLLGEPLLLAVVYLLVGLLCFLMVSELPMFSFKLKGLKGARSQLILVAVAIASIVALGQFGCAITILAYVLLSVLEMPSAREH